MLKRREEGLEVSFPQKQEIAFISLKDWC